MGSLKFKLTPNEPVINEENTIKSAHKRLFTKNWALHVKSVRKTSYVAFLFNSTTLYFQKVANNEEEKDKHRDNCCTAEEESENIILASKGTCFWQQEMLLIIYQMCCEVIIDRDSVLFSRLHCPIDAPI